MPPTDTAPTEGEDTTPKTEDTTNNEVSKVDDGMEGVVPAPADGALEGHMEESGAPAPEGALGEHGQPEEQTTEQQADEAGVGIVPNDIVAAIANDAAAAAVANADAEMKHEGMKQEMSPDGHDMGTPGMVKHEMHMHHPGQGVPPEVAAAMVAGMPLGSPHGMHGMAMMGGHRTSTEAGLSDKGSANKRARRKAEPIKPFNDMMYELMAFRAREGHCRVPVDNKSALGRWVASLRSQYSSLQKGYPTADLTEERLMVLRSIDFIWDLQQFDSDARWKRQFEELVQYKRDNGHCNAPQSTPLGKWVKMQRENFRETQLRAAGTLPQNRTKPRPTLSEERIGQLNTIGFQWKVAPPAAGWEHRFDELVDYKRLHGDCNVPQAWPENRQLGRWVMKQRCQYTLRQKGERCQITDERIGRLNDLGFSWTAPSFRKNKTKDKDFAISPRWM
eukprot:CAMPEP_0172442936 /NCGR_PEP_ID=MMETSP1065-20121228/3274_1 /TAXON_ID=265537 /ORGANISM="Amphiprora paludosa, Strain CCMP125" /LENGTH=446 /DNA_ID=CAMNT_0013192983 /DNA_START=9 /DNA_END=1349 /DNA_ORIENTATION=+